MTTQHTPGEWYHTGTSAGQHLIASEYKGDTIAVVYHDNEANARLIAAAPELLEALTALLKGPTPETIRQAEAVILKATTNK